MDPTKNPPFSVQHLFLKRKQLGSSSSCSSLSSWRVTWVEPPLLMLQINTIWDAAHNYLLYWCPKLDAQPYIWTVILQPQRNVWCRNWNIFRWKCFDFAPNWSEESLAADLRRQLTMPAGVAPVAAAPAAKAAAKAKGRRSKMDEAENLKFQYSFLCRGSMHRFFSYEAFRQCFSREWGGMGWKRRTEPATIGNFKQGRVYRWFWCEKLVSGPKGSRHATASLAHTARLKSPCHENFDWTSWVHVRFGGQKP